MRLFIGSFAENVADRVIEDLRKGGVRAELRHSLYINSMVRYYIEGKIKELKEKYKEGEICELIKKWENYLQKVKEIYVDGMDEKEFRKKFLEVAMPESKKYDEIRELIEKDVDIEEIEEKFGKEKLDEFGKHFMEELNLVNQLHTILELNGIKYEKGKMRGKLPDEFTLKIYLDIEDEEAKEYNAKTEMKIFVDKKIDVYANLIDTIYEIRKIERLCQEKREYTPLLLIADIIWMVKDKIENKIDLEKFKSKALHMEEGNKEIIINENALLEILKTMEKAELIKIKKGKIVLKS